MEIEYNIEKLEDKYFDLQLKFKTHELETTIDFSLVDNNIKEFVNFVNNIHLSFINSHIHYDKHFHIHDEDDGNAILISYIEDNIKITYNLIQFHFIDSNKILLAFMEISDYLEKNY